MLFGSGSPSFRYYLFAMVSGDVFSGATKRITASIRFIERGALQEIKNECLRKK